LGLQDVHGISEAETRSILEARAERPFIDVGDFLRRTTVSKPVVEALAHAGGFDAIDTGTRRDRLYKAMTTEVKREGDQLALALDPGESVLSRADDEAVRGGRMRGAGDREAKRHGGAVVGRARPPPPP
jgi:DNA polymerase III alpha subunit